MKFLVVMILLLSEVSFAEGFYCLPSLKQTGLRVEKSDTTVKIEIKNPMGYDFMPQFDGPTSASSLSFQKMQFEDLKELGSFFVFEWDISKCQLDAKNKSVNCDGASENKVKSIQSFYLSTTEVTEKIRNDQSAKFKYRLNLDKEGSLYFVSLEFYDQNCKSF